MNRGVSAAVQSAWASDKNSPAHLIALRFDASDGGPLLMTDSYRNIIWNGELYFALGHFLNFSGLTETFELRVADVTVELSGVDSSRIAIFLQRKYLHRQLVINKLFLDAGQQLVVDPFPIHDGRMDEPRISEEPDSGRAVIEVASRDQFSDFERLSGRHINSTDQKKFFPNDRSFDQLAVFNQQAFIWGRLREPPATGLGAALTRLVYSDFWRNIFNT